eukprot:TRINITY_DN23830_c0_g1_i1.p1 TRINITY_DN23830_c0_g1~~TRINITY_DN23830_c0_g1_i1.p1  ORF type:complete len:421 (-),score=57.89 TRINITY_DN23830_c0_g1_i1:92-1354(-)
MWWNTGPHLKRRMEADSGKVPGRTYKSHSYFKATDSVDEFKQILISKYGSLTRAWQIGLDTDGSGLLDMREFCEALHFLGFHCNMRTLWFLLDEDNSGYITLSEIDPEACAALEKFRAISTAKYHSIPNMWKKVMDQDRSDTVGLTEFVEGCRALGYDDEEEEIAKLFSYLITKPGCDFVQLRDLQFLQTWETNKRKMIERTRYKTGWANKDPFIRGEPRLPETMQAVKDQREGKVSHAAQVGIDWQEEIEKFRSFLIGRFGSLPKAFDAMDANGSGGLSLTEFQTMAVSVLQYCRLGEASRLFIAFNGDDPDATLSHEELGIPQNEWAAHRMQVTLEKRMKDHATFLNATAPVGKSPRAKRAEARHLERHLEKKKSNLGWAFNSPLPRDWGPPPLFMPTKPRPGMKLPELTQPPHSARF